MLFLQSAVIWSRRSEQRHDGHTDYADFARRKWECCRVRQLVYAVSARSDRPIRHRNVPIFGYRCIVSGQSRNSKPGACFDRRLAVLRPGVQHGADRRFKCDDNPVRVPAICNVRWMGNDARTGEQYFQRSLRTHRYIRSGGESPGDSLERRKSEHLQLFPDAAR